MNWTFAVLSDVRDLVSAKAKAVAMRMTHVSPRGTPIHVEAAARAIKLFATVSAAPKEVSVATGVVARRELFVATGFVAPQANSVKTVCTVKRRFPAPFPTLLLQIRRRLINGAFILGPRRAAEGAVHMAQSVVDT